MIESGKFGEQLSEAFDAWRAGNGDGASSDTLRKVIEFARENGVDLVFRIPRRVLEEPASRRSILLQDVIEHSSATEDNDFVFEIPSALNRGAVGLSKRLILNLTPDGSGIVIGSEVPGVLGRNAYFGMFIPEEVTSLQPK